MSNHKALPELGTIVFQTDGGGPGRRLLDRDEAVDELVRRANGAGK